MAKDIIPTADQAESLRRSYRDKADELSGRLYELKNIAHVVAFAAEARRTLEGVEFVKTYDKRTETAIDDHVRTSNNWSELPDETGTVLDWVTGQLDEVNSEMTSALYAAAAGAPLDTDPHQ